MNESLTPITLRISEEKKAQIETLCEQAKGISPRAAVTNQSEFVRLAIELLVKDADRDISALVDPKHVNARDAQGAAGGV